MPPRPAAANRSELICAALRSAILERALMPGMKLPEDSLGDESYPGKGMIAARELVQRENVAALIGGLDTPVSLAIVPFANEAKAPFIGPWAAGAPVTRNGAEENYVFRVSAVDEYVDEAIAEHLVSKLGAKKPGMILINNP